MLLGHIAAFDRRTIGEVDARAWAAALNDIPLDPDTLDAVARFFGTAPKDGESQRWIQPHHVRTIRAGIRADRIAAAHLLHEAAPDETPAQFIAHRRQQLAAAGDGHIPPATIRQALTGPPHPSVAGAVRAVPPLPSDQPPPYVPAMARDALVEAVPGFARDGHKHPELAVACPKESCRAQPWKPCKRPAGKGQRGTAHGSRQDAWAAGKAQSDAG
jgi:hypothetical protein